MHKSKFFEAYEKREKWSVTLDVTGMFGHTGEQLPKITFWINPLSDDIAAIKAAAAAADRIAKGLTDGARASLVEDHDLLLNLKTAEALWRCCRDVGNPEEPAFITPEWMLDNFDADQVGALLNCYLECRKRKGPMPWDITSEWIDMVRDACVEQAGSPVPETPLAAFSREYLTDFVSSAMVQWDSERKLLLRRIDELEQADDETEA